jgi:hypothetical protein
MRSIGIVGKDLIHNDGRWYSIEEARSYAEQHIALAREAGKNIVTHRVLRTPRAGTKSGGFIYFLWSGNHIKIGYSADPLRRLAELSTSLPLGVRSLVCVPGTVRDERRLHHALKLHRRKGEWFAATLPVVQTLQHVLALGHVSLPSDPSPIFDLGKLVKSEIQ